MHVSAEISKLFFNSTDLLIEQPLHYALEVR
jgi:hypothetical protein